MFLLASPRISGVGSGPITWNTASGIRLEDPGEDFPGEVEHGIDVGRMLEAADEDDVPAAPRPGRGSPS